MSDADQARMAKSADAADLKSAGDTLRGGSSPPPGTNVYAGIFSFLAPQTVTNHLRGGCFGGCWSPLGVPAIRSTTES